MINWNNSHWRNTRRKFFATLWEKLSQRSIWKTIKNGSYLTNSSIPQPIVPIRFNLLRYSKSSTQQIQSRINNYSCGCFVPYNFQIYYDKKLPIHSVKSYWMQNLSSKSIFFTELKNNRLVKNGGQKRKVRYRAFSAFLI